MLEFASTYFKIQIKSQIIVLLLSVFCFSNFAVAQIYNSAVVEGVVDEKYLIAISDSKNWNIGEILPVHSQNTQVGVFAFVEIQSVRQKGGRFEVKLKLVRQSRHMMIRSGDYIKHLDLTTESESYVGATELMIKKSSQNVSAKYRPLVYQGVYIGETAQTLYDSEFLINFAGNVFYGLNENLSINSWVPMNVLGRPNVSFKYKLYDSDTTTLASGLSYVRHVSDDESSLNLNFYWDSISSESLISHIYLGLGLIRWNGAVDAQAIKAVSSSNFQTGYEVILSNWDRFLIGPNFNFDKKALGGYLAYEWIYDRIHVHLALNADDIASFKYSTNDGYFVNFDVFWRF